MNVDIEENEVQDAADNIEAVNDDPVSDMRSSLDEAFSKHEDTHIEDENRSDEKESTLTLDEHKATIDANDVDTTDGTAPDIADSATADADTSADTSDETASKSSASNPPVGWKAEAREAWNDVPEAAKAQIAERERDIAITMQDTAEARRVAKTFSDTLMPFKQSLEGMGYNDPFRAVHDIMGAASRMASGSAQERAHAAAEVIKSFNIDINELDNALVGAGAGAGEPDQISHIESLLDKRLAPVNSFLSEIEQSRQAQQQALQSAAVTDVETFMSDKEFAADVRLDMADLMDLAAARNQPMTLQEAYDKACLMQPEVSSVIQQRQRAELARKASEEAKSKRLAASSVSGTPAGGGVAKRADTLTDALNEAWDYHTRAR